MAGRRGMYGGDRRRKEDARKAKQEAKRARKAERRETGESGPEVGEAAAVSDQGEQEWVWFSPSKGRTLITSSSTAPDVPGVDDWTLVSAPPAREP
ncbi:MAG TPA: hypothetical protein VMI34_18535 [Candidatus Bathyarchaeia archaeon]|nr:hypothetical protein [Candidatus Bathyarchaeia archaeon]